MSSISIKWFLFCIDSCLLVLGVSASKTVSTLGRIGFLTGCSGNTLFKRWLIYLVRKMSIVGVPVQVVFHTLATSSVNLPQFFANRGSATFAGQVIVIVLLSDSSEVHEVEFLPRSWVVVVIGASSHVDRTELLSDCSVG